MPDEELKVGLQWLQPDALQRMGEQLGPEPWGILQPKAAPGVRLARATIRGGEVHTALRDLPAGGGAGCRGA